MAQRVNELLSSSPLHHIPHPQKHIPTPPPNLPILLPAIIIHRHQIPIHIIDYPRLPRPSRNLILPQTRRHLPHNPLFRPLINRTKPVRILQIKRFPGTISINPQYCRFLLRRAPVLLHLLSRCHPAPPFKTDIADSHFLPILIHSLIPLPQPKKHIEHL